MSSATPECGEEFMGDGFISGLYSGSDAYGESSHDETKGPAELIFHANPLQFLLR